MQKRPYCLHFLLLSFLVPFRFYSTLSQSLIFYLLKFFCLKALDQFLEGLIKNGLNKDQVIRVGGRSKSTVLEGRNLRDLSRLAATQEEAKRSDFKATLFSIHSFLSATHFVLLSFLLIGLLIYIFRKWKLRREAEEYEENIKNYSQLKQKKEFEWSDLRPFLEAQAPGLSPFPPTFFFFFSNFDFLQILLRRLFQKPKQRRGVNTKTKTTGTLPKRQRRCLGYLQ